MNGQDETERDQGTRQVAGDQAQRRERRVVNVGDRHRVEHDVTRLGVLTHHVVQLAAKDTGVGEEEVLVEEHREDVVHPFDGLRVVGLPTGGAAAATHLDHPRTRGAPHLDQDRQGYGDRQTHFDAEQDDADPRHDGEGELDAARVPDAA